MSFSLLDLQNDIYELLNDTIYPGQPIHEQAVSDIEILEHFPDGSVMPYIAVQYGDVQQWGSTSFAGPIGDDYVLPIYLKIVVGGGSGLTGIPLGRELYAKGLFGMLGAEFPWAGQIRKRFGGSQIPVKNSSGGIEAIMFPLSFGIVLQLVETPDPEPEP